MVEQSIDINLECLDPCQCEKRSTCLFNNDVKWEDIRGTSFPVKQGVRQGGTLSAPLYKLYIHPLLEKLEDSKLGLSLGGAHIGTPTCADDMVLMANNEWDLQAMIDITELFASQRRYTLHPTKSCVLHINQSGDDSDSFTYVASK